MASSLSYLAGQELTWVPTMAFKARYDLVAPDSRVLATLDMSNWTSKAQASVSEGTLFIRKENWSGLKVGIYALEQGPLVATYQRKWTGTRGQLVFPDGHSYNWNKINFWGTQKAWTDSTGNTVYVQLSAKGFSRTSTVLIHPQATDIPELSLLVVLGLYNIIIERRDAAAASAGATG